MTIEAKIDETNKLLTQLIDAVRAAPVPTTPAPAQGKPAVVTKPAKPAAAAKPTVAAPQPETTAADEDMDFDSPVEGDAPKALTVDDARQALVKLQKAKGSAEASRGVLKANGLASLASLKDEQQDLIAKVISSATALMPKA